MLIFNQLLRDGIDALREQTPLERFFRIFWLLGPFIFLIERTPADIWLSLLTLIFLVRTTLNRDSSWTRVPWVRAFFMFWLVCMLSAAASSQALYSITELLIWGRFPIFVVATVFWLGTDERLLRLMLVSSVIAMMIMTGIMLTEFVFKGAEITRLSWPYGDLNPGNYLAKFSSVGFLALFIWAHYQSKLIFAGSMSVLLGVLIALFLSGERMNFLLLLFALICLVTLAKNKRGQHARSFGFTIVMVLLVGYLVASDRYERIGHGISSFGGELLSLIRPQLPGPKPCHQQIAEPTGNNAEPWVDDRDIYRLAFSTNSKYSHYFFGRNWYVLKDGDAVVEIGSAPCGEHNASSIRVATSEVGSASLAVGLQTNLYNFEHGLKLRFASKSAYPGIYSVEILSLNRERSIAKRYEIIEPNKWQIIDLSFSPDELREKNIEGKGLGAIRFWLSTYEGSTASEFRGHWDYFNSASSPNLGVQQFSNNIDSEWELADLEIIQNNDPDHLTRNHHFMVINGGWIAFKHAPLLGVGPAAYRIISPSLLANEEEASANNHPHNFFIQLLAETGLIGTIFGCYFIFCIWMEGWRVMRRYPDNDVLKISFIVPVAMFLPFATNGDFFGQWNNTFTWSAVALSLSLCKATDFMLAPNPNRLERADTKNID